MGQIEEKLMDDLDKDEEERHTNFIDDKVTGVEKKSTLIEKEIDECPSCGKKFKSIMKHLVQTKKCKISDQEMRKLEERSKIIRREKNRTHNRQYREKLGKKGVNKM